MMRKWLVAIVFAVMCSVMVFIATRGPEKMRITLVKDAYVVIRNEEVGRFQVHLFINQRHPSIINLDYIIQSYLENNGNLIPIMLESIQCVQKCSILNATYYDFSYQFMIDFPQELALDNAWLVIVPSYQEELRLEIGSFSYYIAPTQSVDFFRVTHLKGVMNSEENKRLVAVLLEINGFFPFDILSIEALNHQVTVGNPIILTTSDQSNDEFLDLLVQHGYYPEGEASQMTVVDVLEDTMLLLPLYYTHDYLISTLAFRLICRDGGYQTTSLIDSFCFFTHHLQQVNVHDLVFYEYSV